MEKQGETDRERDSETMLMFKSKGCRNTDEKWKWMLLMVIGVPPALPSLMMIKVAIIILQQ